MLDKHWDILPEEQKSILETSFQDMFQDLDTAKRPYTDFPDVEPMEVAQREYTGRRGRPRITLDEDALRAVHRHAGPTTIAPLFSVSSRTVRRRLLESGLEEPGEPVYVEWTYQTDSGGWCVQRVYLGSSRSNVGSQLSDNDLDNVMRQILESFPHYGRRMIDGHLRYLGHHVPRSRLQQSYIRVHGPPVAAFGARRIQRRRYNVKGFNSLWHHDGQHGNNIFLLTKSAIC